MTVTRIIRIVPWTWSIDGATCARRMIGSLLSKESLCTGKNVRFARPHDVVCNTLDVVLRQAAISLPTPYGLVSFFASTPAYTSGVPHGRFWLGTTVRGNDETTLRPYDQAHIGRALVFRRQVTVSNNKLRCCPPVAVIAMEMASHQTSLDSIPASTRTTVFISRH